jgi:hypothetical protein
MHDRRKTSEFCFHRARTVHDAAATGRGQERQPLLIHCSILEKSSHFCTSRWGFTPHPPAWRPSYTRCPWHVCGATNCVRPLVFYLSVARHLSPAPLVIGSCIQSRLFALPAHYCRRIYTLRHGYTTRLLTLRASIAALVRANHFFSIRIEQLLA